MQTLRFQDRSDGASFRNVDQIRELAGCALLTISPDLMKELTGSREPVHRKADSRARKGAEITPFAIDQKTFRYRVNEDAMATEKIAEGMRKFAADIAKLEKLVARKVN